MSKKKIITKSKRGIFLDVLRTTGNVSASARAVNITPRAFHALKKTDTEFSEEWDIAKEESLDALEEALRLRALEGVEKPIYYAGKKCGTQRSYSDTLGMYILKTQRGDVEREDKPVASPSSNKAEGMSACEVLLEKLDVMARNLESKSLQHYNGTRGRRNE